MCQINTATVDGKVLATSNGHSGRSRQKENTSKESSSGVGRALRDVPCIHSLAGLVREVTLFIQLMLR